MSYLPEGGAYKEAEGANRHGPPFSLTLNQQSIYYLKENFFSTLAIRCHPKSKVSGFHRLHHIYIPESKFTYRKFKRYIFLLTRLQCDASKAFQLFHRTGHRSKLVLHVKLGYLGTFILSGILKVESHSQHIFLLQIG